MQRQKLLVHQQHTVETTNENQRGHKSQTNIMKLSFNLGVLLLLMGGGGGLGSRSDIFVHGRNVNVKILDHGDFENVCTSFLLFDHQLIMFLCCSLWSMLLLLL